MYHIDKATMRCGMISNAEKNKLMMSGDNIITTDIAVHGQKVETVHQFEYLVACYSVNNNIGDAVNNQHAQLLCII